MNESDRTRDRPVFLRPPIVETIIGVQFTPLRGFRSGHYGRLWHVVLDDAEWLSIDDEPILPSYTERFDDIRLKMTKSSGGPSGPGIVRMKVRDAGRTKSIQLQPDKLYFSWNREHPEAVDFAQAKSYFADIFDKLSKFAKAANLGPVEPNLWDVTYINQIPSGDLWKEPREWYKVLPRFFPVEDPGATGVRFASYDGTWHFEIEPQLGRLHLNIAKMVRTGGAAPVLYMKLAARGEIKDLGSDEWLAGIERGHLSCTSLFCAITSPAAQAEWGIQS